MMSRLKSGIFAKVDVLRTTRKACSLFLSVRIAAQSTAFVFEAWCIMSVTLLIEEGRLSYNMPAMSGGGEEG
jgi:hypothetical protein